MFNRTFKKIIEKHRDRISKNPSTKHSTLWRITVQLKRKLKEGKSIVNIEKNESIEKKYDGKRCFIVGSAPSINEVKLEKINDEFIFLLNKTYLLKDKFGSKPDCIVLSDPLAMQEYGNEITLEEFKYVFLSSNIETDYNDENLHWFSYYSFPTIYDGYYSKSITKPLYHGHTVALFACQIAIAMGFKEIILLGIDLNFSPESPHFYQSSDREKIWSQKISLSKRKWMIDAFRYLVYAAKTDGIRIINASPHPGLEGIEKKSFDDLFNTENQLK